MGTLKNLVNIGIGIGKRKAHRKCTAIIAAGGSSSRMGGENKQFIDLCGIPVLARTLLMYESNSNIDDIVVVARKPPVVIVAHRGSFTVSALGDPYQFKVL